MNPERWKEIERLFQAGLDLEPNRRKEYLDENCHGDESLQKEVESLLQTTVAEAFLSDPAMELAAKSLARERDGTTARNLIGSSLSHYRIIDRIGEGGMGEVYRAEDSILGRQVAVKIVSETFSNDPERLARFEREAKLLASLNHSNIATLHGLEESGGKRFIVMELVDGETLAQLLLKGPLPVADTLEVCRQIAEGLEAAHERGVIHRDLKPANIMITPDGKVKILDFGLAKALATEPAASAAAQSPTITEAAARAGTILGTAAYMSPEQAKGKAADKRADIWAFGCILYECLTGKAPFKGETVSETLAKILEGTPDWSLLPAATPWRAKDVLRRCLQRNPKERLHDIGDARIEIGESVSEPPQVNAVAQPFPLRWILISAATLVIGLVGGALLLRHFSRPALLPAQPVIRAAIRLEAGQWLDGQRRVPPGGFDQPTRTAMALSSDGRFMVYSAVKENPTPQDKPQIYFRRMDQMKAVPIAGTEGGSSPFLSPDDRWVGFWADGKLKKVLVDGGVPVTLCDVPGPFGFTWGSDNRIVFVPRNYMGLSRISADGGNPEALTAPDKSKEECSHRLPHALPAAKGILFTITRDPWDMQPRVAVLEAQSGKWRILLDDAADARYIATGHLAFMRQGTLMLVPFDTDRLLNTGEPFPAVENVTQALNTGHSYFDTAAGQFDICASGSLVFAPGGIFPDREDSLVWVDHRGNAEPITSLKAPFATPRLSPDGQRIAYWWSGKEKQIWVYDLNRGTNTQLTAEGLAERVTWSPAGTHVVFGWSKTGVANLYAQTADGSSPMVRLTTSEYPQNPGSFSPDGEVLAFIEGGRPDTGADIMLFQKRDSRVTPFVNSRFAEIYPEFSPDGRWMAYATYESGRERDVVYVQPFPGPGGKFQISSDNGTEPLWSRDGKQLFYRRSSHVGGAFNQVWAVDVQTGSGFSVSKPRLVFEEAGYGTNGPIRGWDISRDGKRFLMVKVGERKPQPLTELILVQNWIEEIKRLVSTGRK